MTKEECEIKTSNAIMEMRAHIADLEKAYNETEELLDKQTEETYKLLKENAELKEDNKAMANNYFNMEQKFYKNLTKATEIIKKFSEFAKLAVEYGPEHPQEYTDLWNKLCEQAEQFLKGKL